MENRVKKILFAAYDLLNKMSTESIVVGNEPNCRLIFPSYKNDERRVSEQELRQIFIDCFIRHAPDLYYSVETPTKATYLFKDKEELKCDEEGELYQSANVDMCIHQPTEDNKFERVSLIEFKALNQEQFCVSKDILKLNCENRTEKVGRYFIHLMDTTSKGEIAPEGTRENIAGKYKAALDKYGNNNDIKIYTIFLGDGIFEYQNGKLVKLCE